MATNNLHAENRNKRKVLEAIYLQTFEKVNASTKDEDIAAVIASELTIHLDKNFETMMEMGSYKGYYAVAAKNLCTDEFRRRQSKKKKDEKEGNITLLLENISDWEQQIMDFSNNAISPEEHEEKQRQIDLKIVKIKEAVSTLPPVYQESFRQKHEKGLSFKQMEMHDPTKTAAHHKTNYQRTLKKIRNHLKD